MGTFLSKALETQYRRNRLKENLSAAEIVLAVASTGVLLFLLIDYHLLGTADPFSILVGARLAMFAFSVAIWKRLRSTVRQLNPQGFDRALVLWGSVITAAQICMSFMRQDEAAGLFLVRLFTILLMYCFVPLPLLQQSLLALAMTAGMVICLAVKPVENSTASTALVWTLMAGNVLGASISRQLHRSGRLQFSAIRREAEVRRGLEIALAELKTLRGIIPICSHCKNIRDDEGSWHQLEEYICSQSDAEFSHGICPPCVEKFYP